MNTIVDIFKACFWALKIRKYVVKVVVYQLPNETSDTPSRIFYVHNKEVD